MNRNQAITEVYNECITTYGCTDLIQFVFAKICEQDDIFIGSLIDNGKLKHYIAKLIYNTKHWQRTEWTKQQAVKEIPTENFNDLPLENYNELEIPIEKIYWFKAEILKLYSELGTYRAVAKKTGINVSAVFKYVNAARNDIKQLI